MIRLLPCLIVLLFWHSTSLAASKYEDSVKELAEGVAAEAIKMKKSRLALLDFVDNKGEVTPIGQFLAEELATLRRHRYLRSKSVPGWRRRSASARISSANFNRIAKKCL